MEIFTASRLTSGNRIFPSQIIIDDHYLTLKDPGLFSGKEKTIFYNKISMVDIDCPFVGFSTLIIDATGEGKISIHGFTRNEVTRMKGLILEKQKTSQ